MCYSTKPCVYSIRTVGRLNVHTCLLCVSSSRGEACVKWKNVRCIFTRFRMCVCERESEVDVCLCESSMWRHRHLITSAHTHIQRRFSLIIQNFIYLFRSYVGQESKSSTLLFHWLAICVSLCLFVCSLIDDSACFGIFVLLIRRAYYALSA